MKHLQFTCYIETGSTSNEELVICLAYFVTTILTMKLLKQNRKGIAANTISPGYIATDMLNALSEPLRNQIVEQITVGRFGEPDEVARAVAFLGSSESAFIIGSNLNINGGHYLS